MQQILRSYIANYLASIDYMSMPFSLRDLQVNIAGLSHTSTPKLVSGMFIVSM